MEVIIRHRGKQEKLIFKTCFDLVNDWLASGLGKGMVQPIVPAENPPEGEE